MKKHKHELIVVETELRLDGSCKEYSYCNICNRDWTEFWTTELYEETRKISRGV